MPIKPERITDPRLLGTWFSDKGRTLSEWFFSPEATDQAREKVASMFGKLKIRYTLARVFTEFENDKTVCPYRVLATDDSSVAILRRTDGRDEIQHIHFAGENVYWVTCGRNREFFYRVQA